MNSNIRGLLVMHTVLCLGAALVIFLLYFTSRFDNHPFNLTTGIGITVIAPLLLAVACVFLGSYSFNKKVSELGTTMITDENVNEYRAAYIVKWSLLEASVLFNALAYFSYTNHFANLIMAFIALVLLFVSSPNK